MLMNNNFSNPLLRLRFLQDLKDQNLLDLKKLEGTQGPNQGKCLIIFTQPGRRT